jgi:hypothetical protein
MRTGRIVHSIPAITSIFCPLSNSHLTSWVSGWVRRLHLGPYAGVILGPTVGWPLSAPPSLDAEIVHDPL